MTKWYKEDRAYLYDHDECTRLRVFKYKGGGGWSGYVLHILKLQPDDEGEREYFNCVKYLNLNTKQLPEAKIKALDILQKYQTGELR